MLAIYTGKDVTPEVNLGVHKSCMPQPSAFKAAHSGFETQKSETWVSVTSQMSTKNLKKKTKGRCHHIYAISRQLRHKVPQDIKYSKHLNIK